MFQKKKTKVIVKGVVLVEGFILHRNMKGKISETKSYLQRQMILAEGFIDTKV